MLNEGWTFEHHGLAKGDSLFNSKFAHEIYTQADPSVSTRVTVPILWDKKNDTIVSNESSEIIRMFNTEFNDLTNNIKDFYPLEKRKEIDELDQSILENLSSRMKLSNQIGEYMNRK